MATVTREVVVCDVCAGEADVATVTVAIDGAAQSAELCTTHRQQLQEAVAGVLGASTSKAGQRTPAPRGRRATSARAPAGKRAISTAGTSTAAAERRMPRTTCPHCGLELGVQNLSRHIAAKHPGAA